MARFETGGEDDPLIGGVRRRCGGGGPPRIAVLRPSLADRGTISPDHPSVARTACGSRRGPVLVVEPDGQRRRQLAAALLACGFPVRTAADGVAAAVELLVGGLDAAVISEHVGDVDGIDFVRWLRGEARVDVPVVVLGMDQPAHWMRSALDSGADLVCDTSVDPGVLASALRALLRRAEGVRL